MYSKKYEKFIQSIFYDTEARKNKFGLTAYPDKLE